MITVTQRAIGYIRVSTENQNGADTYGLETQRDAITRYCGAQGLELIEIFEDAALSGCLQPLERPGLLSALNALKSGEVQKFIVPRLDRLARDAMLNLWLEKEIRKAGTELVSIAEPYRWDDPTQKLLLTMVAAFSEFERSLISSRLSSGRKTKARNGGYAGGKAPIGYKALKGSKVLEVDDTKASVVQRVFELRGAGASMQKIADTLNEEGLTTAQGQAFHKMQVKRIIDRRPIYEGMYRYTRIEAKGRHQPIM